MKLFVALIVVISLLANGYLVSRLWRDDKPVPNSLMGPVVMRTEGGLLEVSTVKALEQFQTTRDHTILGVQVGRTVARIQVPAFYRYHIELAREWKIRREGALFIVVAPAVKPSLPVAIDTAQLQAHSAGGWSLLTGSALVERLQRQITQSLGEKADSSYMVELQREAARKTVTEFVAKWLLTQSEWQSTPPSAIRVFFADEPIRALGTLPPPYLPD